MATGFRTARVLGALLLAALTVVASTATAAHVHLPDASASGCQVSTPGPDASSAGAASHECPVCAGAQLLARSQPFSVTAARAARPRAHAACPTPLAVPERSDDPARAPPVPR